MTVLAPYRALLAARLFLCLLCRRSLTLCQARDHGKSGSLIRSTALLPRSKLGTRHTQTTCTLPPDNRQKAVVSQTLLRQPTAPEVERAACAEIDMARRPSSRTMPLARRREPAARWRAPRLGAAEVRRLHHSRTTPAPLPHHSHVWEWCSSYENRAGVCVSYEEACAVI